MDTYRLEKAKDFFFVMVSLEHKNNEQHLLGESRVTKDEQ